MAPDTDALLVTLDDNYSSDSEVTNRWQYSTWFGCMPASCTNVTQDSNGTITDFIYANAAYTNSGAPTDFNAFANRTCPTSRPTRRGSTSGGTCNVISGRQGLDAQLSPRRT